MIDLEDRVGVRLDLACHSMRGRGHSAGDRGGVSLDLGDGSDGSGIALNSRMIK